MTTRRAILPGGLRPPGLILWLLVALVAVGSARPAAAGPGDRRLVVVLYPEDTHGSPGSVGADLGIRSTFAAECPDYVEIRNEFVDTSGAGAGTEAKRLQLGYLREKYAGRKVDLVVAVLSSALDFALTHGADLFPGAPVVYCAVDEREIRDRRLPSGVAGVPMHVDVAATLQIALRLHPGTRRVYVIAGNAPFDQAWVGEARKAFAPYAADLEFEYLIGLPMDDLLTRVADLPERSIIFYLHIFEDGTGKRFVPAEALERLAARANAPIYGRADTHVGRGLVGGHVFSFEAEGRTAARLGGRILAGEEPGSVSPVEPGGALVLFDARQLRRWGIDERDLPPGSVVRYKERSFWDGYRWHVLGVVGLAAIEALLIAALLLQRAKRRRAEVAARESEGRFQLMADAAPVLIWSAGLDKACTYVNRPWQEFTGRSLQQEVGNGWADGVHPDDLARCLAVYAAHFDARKPFEMVYRLRRHDGAYRWVLDRGVPHTSPGGEFAGYVGACTDVTERRLAEDGLRASQQELRLLTGRLLEAQEAERRRIARELHDDLNQRLGLLSVELDLLAQRPPASTREMASGLRALSVRVKELSTAVHDLSHQLHPSKLEHLGLVGALRALCREMIRHHGLEVAFTHRDLPNSIPEAVTLCLYRIAQEALRNVVKHSGTSYAAVELSGGPDQIRLRVTDDGVGFDPASADEDRGLGLVSMRERLYLVGGRMAVESRPGGGTRIDVCVPLRERTEDANGEATPSPCEPDLVTAGPAGGT
jgi:PAS domain S-box-containing protein